MAELMVAIAILAMVVLPLAFAWIKDARVIRGSYQRAIAMEIVDGEFEVLLAGEWRRYGQGTHDYATTARAASNLPPGRFTLTVNERRIRLDWKPEVLRGIGAVVREMEVR
jgi:hypothetical protein